MFASVISVNRKLLTTPEDDVDLSPCVSAIRFVAAGATAQRGYHWYGLSRPPFWPARAALATSTDPIGSTGLDKAIAAHSNRG